MKFSKKIIVSGLFLLLVSGLVLLGALQQEREQITKIPINKPTNIEFSEEAKSDLPIKVDKKVKIQTPETLSLITFKLMSISEEEAENIANKLGFNDQIKIIKDVTEGNKYFWVNDNNYLWITPEKSHIKFGMSQFPENISSKELADQDFENIAIDFVNEKLNLDDSNVKTSSISYYKLAPKTEGFVETSREETQIYHVNLTYKNISYPVLTSIPNFQILFVEILPNGEVYKAGAYLIDEVTKSEKSYEVKTIDDIKDTLDEAHLVSLENDYIYLMDIEQDDIKNIDIENIEVGYYLDDINMDTTLQPIFLLEGEIEIKNSTADWAKLYMPALK